LPAEREEEEMSYKKVNKKKIDWPSFKIIKCYSYRDKKNVLRHQTVRAKDKNNPKIFMQRQPKPGIKAPDDKNKNHWLWNLKGITVLPYRLPELIKGKDPLFLFEGEKDVDNAREKLGITASTNPMGSGKWPKFEKDLNPWFKDRELFIIPDNDEVGEKHLEQIANSLQGIAKSIKVLRLPGAKDFSDWLEIEGNSEEKFLTLKFEAREWKPKSNLVLRGPKKKEKKQKEFMPSLYAKKILAKYKVIYDKHKRLWFYDQEEGIWKDNFETLCRSILRKGLLASFDSQVHENEVIFALRDLSYEENIPEEPACYLIPFKNKIYDLRKDKLYDFKPGYFFINKLGVNYNPKNKDYPNIDNLFKQIVGKREVITLKEIIAYTMFRDYPYPKAFMLYGNGANGKSTYCQVVRKVIGNENVSSVSLNTLIYNTFGTAGLYGKLINISPEMSYNVLKKTDVIKSLTGKDLVRGERKFKDEFHFVNYAKLIFIGNEIPYSTDKSFAFYRRMFLVEFPKRFEIKIKADPFIIDRIPEEEFEALAYQSIQVLKELGKNLFTFTRHKRTDKIMEEYERLSDPLGTFLKEKTKDDSKSDIPVKNFNSEFKDFQSKNGLRQWSDKEISRSMSQKGYIKKTLRIATSIKGEYRFYKAYLELSWKV
jgi:putative DNA primase/helicase